MFKYFLSILIIACVFTFLIREGINHKSPLKLRVARSTNDFQKILKFYKEGLGLQVLYQFKDHEGFDGIMLGEKSAPYHFEFTLKKVILLHLQIAKIIC